MAYYDMPRPAAAGRLSRAVQGLIDGYAAWREARLTRAALARLSERELNDIGLSRADLDVMVTPRARRR
jgi:uncharacterized protein YjiS (DUF1127 family)